MAQTEARDHLDPEHEYRAIERALVETARGRWFLAEHGRRARRLAPRPGVAGAVCVRWPCVPVFRVRIRVGFPVAPGV